MLGTKIILIAAEISAILCAILLVWMICLGDVEADEVKAFFISIFIIVAIMLQSFQQSIPWKQD
jgi:hypothetical protein